MVAAATARPTPVRRQRPVSACALAALLVMALGCWLDASPAQAQNFLGAPAKRGGYNSQSASQLQRSRTDPNAHMLVTADEIQYDYSNEIVSAVNHVQIHYAGAVL